MVDLEDLETQKTIVRGALETAPDGQSKEDLEHVLNWAHTAALTYGLLTLVAEGGIGAAYYDGEVRFKITKKGQQLADKARR